MIKQATGSHSLVPAPDRWEVMATDTKDNPDQERSGGQQETEKEEKLVFYTQTEVLLSVKSKKDFQDQLKRWD